MAAGLIPLPREKPEQPLCVSVFCGAGPGTTTLKTFVPPTATGTTKTTETTISGFVSPARFSPELIRLRSYRESKEVFRAVHDDKPQLRGKGGACLGRLTAAGAALMNLVQHEVCAIKRNASQANIENSLHQMACIARR